MLGPHKCYTVSFATTPSQLSRDHEIKIGYGQDKLRRQCNRTFEG
jgi:hypothetical protein